MPVRMNSNALFTRGPELLLKVGSNLFILLIVGVANCIMVCCNSFFLFQDIPIRVCLNERRSQMIYSTKIMNKKILENYGVRKISKKRLNFYLLLYLLASY